MSFEISLRKLRADLVDLKNNEKRIDNLTRREIVLNIILDIDEILHKDLR